MTTIPPEHRPDYQDVDADICDDLHRYLREQDAIGRENGVPTAAIAEAIDVDDSHDTKPKIRAAKQKLLFEAGVPVRGGHSGLYLVAPGDDLDQTVDSIRSRIGALNAAKAALEQSVESYDYDDGVDLPGDTETREEDSPDTEPDIQTTTYECARCDVEMPRDETRWPKSGEYEDRTVCKMCMGTIIINKG